MCPASRPCPITIDERDLSAPLKRRRSGPQVWRGRIVE